MVAIRPFHAIDAEYAAIVQLHDAAWPDDRHLSAEMWRQNDHEWPVEFLNERFVLESNERVVGMGSCYEKYWQHQPGTVHIDFLVHPDHQTQELDALLYAHLVDFLQAQTPPPDVIATRTREDRRQRIRFLRRQGFQPAMRSPRASLNVADFDETRFQGLHSKLAAQGIGICTLAELIPRDPHWKQKLYELRWALIQDVPAVEPPTRPTLAQFEQMILDDPALDPLAWFVAVQEKRDASSPAGAFMGMSNLWMNDPTYKRLDTGLTGVLRAYRRRGIATALKVETIRFAQRAGAQTIETANEENNPMAALNLKLGFQPKAAWISFRKKVT